ncbi:DUF2867 domain-containing protein [Phycisphaeraceae bacterium D3-23]
MPKHILVTGATGYIGGRLIPRLLERGDTVRVRVLVRDKARALGRPWADAVEIVEADLLDPASLAPALQDIHTAYYLVHAMGSKGDFAKRDRTAAENFATAAAAASTSGGVKHTIYLGGLQPTGADASPHLASRAEVGRVLADKLPVTEFRAGPIIGSGSASFEMVRYLTERLPAMVAPRWINNTVQPIAIRDTLAYLLAAAESQPLGVVDIGGDTLTFKQMMLRYANARGLRRLILPVPVLAPKLAARWVGFVTPISNKLAVPLVEGVVQPLTADTAKAQQHFPTIQPLDYADAVERALDKTGRGDIETRWSGALGKGEILRLEDRGGIVREFRRVRADCSQEALFAAFTSLGGDRGYLTLDWAWKLRGLLDQLVGGPGLRRGRRHPTQLLPGEALDFWRVEEVQPNKSLRLRAEMKLPGQAWLQWESQQDGDTTYLEQTAAFRPHGLPGLLYWWALYPMHLIIFTRLAKRIATLAQSLEDPALSTQPAAAPRRAER